MMGKFLVYLIFRNGRPARRPYRLDYLLPYTQVWREGRASPPALTPAPRSAPWRGESEFHKVCRLQGALRIADADLFGTA